MKNFTNDITYCSYGKCKDSNCFRNKRNKAKTNFLYISEADFTDCPNWKDRESEDKQREEKKK